MNAFRPRRARRWPALLAGGLPATTLPTYAPRHATLCARIASESRRRLQHRTARGVDHAGGA